MSCVRPPPGERAPGARAAARRSGGCGELRRGIDLARRGRFNPAIRALSEGIQAEPGRGLLYAWRGLARFQTNRLRGALADFETALRLDPDGCRWISECRRAARAAFGLDGAVRDGMRWTAAAGRAGWSGRLPRLERLSNELEYLSVSRGLRQIMFRNALPGDGFLERAARDGLHAKVLFHVKRFYGFAHQHTRTSPDDPDSFAHVVVGRDVRAAATAEEVYRAPRLGVEGHGALGRLLGFPRCCIEAFGRNFVRDGILDPMFEAAAATKGARLRPGPHAGKVAEVAGYPECNVLLRYFSLRIVPWMPCSFDCRPTRRAARDWLSLGRSVDAEAARDMLELLSQPLRWRCDLGRVKIRTPLFTAAAPSYFPEQPRVIAWRPL